MISVPTFNPTFAASARSESVDGVGDAPSGKVASAMVPATSTAAVITPVAINVGLNLRNATTVSFLPLDRHGFLTGLNRSGLTAGLRRIFRSTRSPAFWMGVQI